MRVKEWYLDGQRVSLAELFISNLKRLSLEDRRAIIAMRPGDIRHLPWGRWSPDVLLVCLEGWR